jgi:hypothetical protein
MQKVLFVFSLIFIAIFCSCKECDDERCDHYHTATKVVKIKFNMDSLNGGFTKAQRQNIVILTNTSFNNSTIPDSLYYLYSGIFTSEECTFLSIQNNNSGTKHSFTNFQYACINSQCCKGNQDFEITSFQYNGNQIKPTSFSNVSQPYLIVINNN